MIRQAADEAAVGLRAAISPRSGETGGDWLADLAVACATGRLLPFGEEVRG